ncbi:MAG: Hypothetical protein AJITA_00878 [Acetilactobacillus jinshanensis]
MGRGIIYIVTALVIIDKRHYPPILILGWGALWNYKRIKALPFNLNKK